MQAPPHGPPRGAPGGLLRRPLEGASASLPDMQTRSLSIAVKRYQDGWFSVAVVDTPYVNGVAQAPRIIRGPRRVQRHDLRRFIGLAVDEVAELEDARIAAEEAAETVRARRPPASS